MIRNALLDSFLIHARALVGFFHDGPNPPYAADVVATDFLDGPEIEYWAKQHPNRPEWFSDVRNQVNWQVAHISYERTKIIWDSMGEIEANISDAFEEFVQMVPPDLLGARWQDIKARLRKGNPSPVILPDYLAIGGIPKASAYPPLESDWYPYDAD